MYPRASFRQRLSVKVWVVALVDVSVAVLLVSVAEVDVAVTVVDVPVGGKLH